MAESAGSTVAPSSPFQGRILKPNLSLDEIRELVAAAERSLQYENPPSDPAQSNARIDQSLFTNGYLSPKNIPPLAPMYLNANAKKRDDVPSRSAQLSLEDLHDIFHEISQDRSEGIRQGKYRGAESIDPEEEQLLRDIENRSLPFDHKKLYEKTRLLARILAKMERPEADDVETAPADSTPELDFPQDPYLELIRKSTFNLTTSWEWIRPLIKDLRKAEENAVAVIYYKRSGEESEDRPGGEEHRIAVPPVRNYLNAWLELLEDTLTRYKSRGINTGIPTPLPRYTSSQQSVGYSDLDMWTGIGLASDVSVTTWLFDNLIDKLNALLKLKPDKIATPYQAPVDATEGGGEPTELKEEKKDDFRAAFLDAGTSYSLEAARLTELLFPQMVEQQLGVAPTQLQEFLSTASLGESALTLDETGYLLAQREFRLELESLLRSLSPADLEMLRAGNRAGFRLTVLRRLHAKLGTNPRFIGAVEQFRDDCVDKLDAVDLAKTSPLIRRKAQALRAQIDKRKNADPATFEQEFVETANATATWDEETGQRLAQLIELRQHLSKETLAQFLKEIEHPPSESEIAALFASLDYIVAERWSPEQIRALSPSQLQAVLGINLSSASEEDRRLILSLCSELIYTRRKELAKKFELDALGRTAETNSADGAEPLTQEQIDALEEKKRLAEAGITGELLALAQGASPEKLQQLVDERKITPEQLRAAQTLRNNLIEERKKELDRERSSTLAKLAELSSFEEKQRFLAAQGYFVDHLQEDDALEEYLQHVQDAEYQSALHTLENHSLLDEEEGFVTDDAADGARQEYGRYDRVRSLGSRRAMGRKHERRRFGRKKKKDLLTKSAETIEKTAGTVLLGPLGRNKTIRRTAGGLAIAALQFFLDASLGGKLLAGLVGGVTTFFAGPAVGLLAGLGTLGAVRIVENALQGIFGGGSAGGASASVSLPTPAIPGITTPLSPAAPTFAAKGAAEIGGPGAFGTPFTATQIMATVGTSTYFVVATASNSALIASFLPPSLNTLGADGTDSPYVVIAKVATDTEGRRINNLSFSTPQTTHQVKYTITVDAKDLPGGEGASYQIALTGLTDEMRVYENTEEREGRPPLTTPSCAEQISFEKLTAVAGASPTFGREQPILFEGADSTSPPSLGPLEIADGRIRLGECTLTYDETFNHTTVMNTITISFNTVDENGAAISTTASSAHTLCFGKCPRLTGGGWPTTGYLTQGPYASGIIRTRNGNTFPATHSRVDAIDIGAGGQDPVPPICTPFSGTAYFFSEHGIGNKRGLGSDYGNHVIVVVDAPARGSGGSSPSGFVLVFAHFNNFDLFDKTVQGPIQLATGYAVSSSQPLGQMGTTGNSTGNHLHYEYRVWAGGQGDDAWKSYSSAETRTRILETLIRSDFRYEDDDGDLVGPSVCPPGTPPR